MSDDSSKKKGQRHVTNRLSALQVNKYAGPGKLTDGGGLYFVVTPSFSRRWVFRYTYAGKQRELFIGPHASLSLAEARRKRDEANAHLKENVDPSTLMNAAARKRIQVERHGIPTFEVAAREYIASLEPSFKNKKARQPCELALLVYAKGLHNIPINAISNKHVTDVLVPLWHSKPETARRLRWRIEAVFGDAIAKGYRDKDPQGHPILVRNPATWQNNLDHMGALKLNKRAQKSKVQHHPSMPYTEAPAFLAELRGREGLAAVALELVILTACRTSEVIGARWEEIDFEQARWSIPAERMKMAEPHDVPLTKPALKLLRSVPRLEAHPFVFVGKDKKHHLSNMAMLALLRRMKREDITPHGFRSTFRTWVAEQTNTPREIAEKCLAHKVEGKVEGSYQHSSLLEKRRILMTQWADYLGNLDSAKPQE